MSLSSSKSRSERLQAAIRLKQARAGQRSDDLPRRPPEAPAFLDELQRGIWLAHTLAPASPAYHLVGACRVHGVLDLEALEGAFGRLVERHRLLRSTFESRDGEVFQRIHDRTDTPLERVPSTEVDVVTTATEVAKIPFDLEHGPLIRLQLVEGDSDRILQLVLHHILADERALAGLWRELANDLSGAPPDGGGPQYDDWAHWRRTAPSSGNEEEQAYWRTKLNPPPGDLELPFDPPAEASAPGGRFLTAPIDGKVAESVRRLSARAGTTPFAVGAFAFRLLLQRLVDGAEFAFATPASIRQHPAMLDMLGAFINPVVVRDPVDETGSVEASLRQFGGSLREALGHASTPFPRIAEAVAPARRDDRHPVFQVMFVHQEHQPLPALGSARLEPLMLDLGAAKFDLTGFLTEHGEAMEVALEYRTDRFTGDRMGWFLEAFQSLLSRLAEAPERVVSDVPWVNESEAALISAAERGMTLEAGGSSLLANQIQEQSRAAPGRPAVRCGERELDHGDLSGRVAALEKALESAGVSAGDRVGLCLPRSLDLVAGVLAIHRVRAAYVPLDPNYPADRNRLVLEDADVRLVLTNHALGGVIGDNGPETLAVEDVPSSADPGDAVQGGEAGDLAYLLYTSGSTGRPKGVAVTQGNLAASTAARLAVYGEAPPVFLLLPSIAFDSSVAGLFGTLAAGGTLVIPTDEEARDPRRLALLIKETGVTHTLCVPALYGALLDVDAPALDGMEVVIVAGEACPPGLVTEHFRRLPGTQLFNEYGPTETTVWSTVHEVAPGDATGAIPIGQPIPGTRLEVLDRLRRPVPLGVPGQAWVSGPTVTRGYWRQPDRTAERFEDTKDGGRRYGTGDLVSWNENGVLSFHGRMDRQLKIRGFRIEPGEIEAALERAPEVERAVVITRPLVLAAEGAPEQLVAFFAATGEGRDEVLREALEATLPAHMVPARFVRLDELPQLPNGKVDRERLASLELEASPVPASGRKAHDREAVMIALWSGLLGRGDVGLDDNFFTLGGHSLLVVQLALAIERDLGMSLTPADVFAHPTVRSLLAFIESRGEGGAPLYDHLFPMQPAGQGTPLIFAIPHFFADLFADRYRGERPVYGLRGVGLRTEGNLGRWPTMTALGTELADEIEHRFPEGPLMLAGYSFGASMAHAATVELEKRGRDVVRLLLIAPMPLDQVRVGPLRLQVNALQEPVTELAQGEALQRWLADNPPWTLSPWRRAWRAVAVEGWRRGLCQVGRLRRRLGLPLPESIQWADVRVDRFRLHAGYRPEPVHSPSLVFNPMEPATSAAATWKQAFAGSVEIVDTPDPHLDQDAVDASRQVILDRLAGGLEP